MTKHLQREQCLKITTGKWTLESIPETDYRIRQLWEDRDDKASGILRSNVSPDIEERIKNIESASEIWNFLEEYCQGQRFDAGTNAWFKLTNTHCNRDEDLSAHIQNLRKHWGALLVTQQVFIDGSCSAVFGEKPSDSLTGAQVLEKSKSMLAKYMDIVFAQIIAASVGSSYNSIIVQQEQYMKRFNEMPKSDELISALETGRNRNLTTRAIRKQVTRSTGETAKKANSRRSNSRKGKGKQIICYNCKQEGHIASNCPEKESAKKAETEEREFAWTAREDNSDDQNCLEQPCEDLEFLDIIPDEPEEIRQDFALEASEENISDDWFLDSGASKHMTGNKSWFSTYNVLDVPGKIHTADNTVSSAGVGNIKASIGKSKLTLQNVLHVPKLTDGLVSVSALTDNGFTIIFEPKKPAVIKKGNIVVCSASRKGGMYRLDLSKESARKAETEKSQEKLSLKLWHHRMGHPHPGALKKVIEENHWADITGKLDKSEVGNCGPCLTAKSKLKKLPGNEATKIEEIGHSLFLDVMGPFEESIDGFKYSVTLGDFGSNFRGGGPVKKKSDAAAKVIQFVNWIETQSGNSVKRIICDNAKEFTEGKLKNFCEDKGISLEPSPPYRPQLNGKAERANRTIMESAKAMLLHSKLPKNFWSYALRAAIFLQNRIISRTSAHGKTPYELIFQRKPKMKNVRTFGCIAYVHVPDAKRKKLQAKSERCLFLGYAPKSYVFMKLQTGEIVNSIDAKFLETERARPSELEWDEDTEYSEPETEMPAQKIQVAPTNNSLEIEDLLWEPETEQENLAENIAQENLSDAETVQENPDEENIQENLLGNIFEQPEMPERFAPLQDQNIAGFEQANAEENSDNSSYHPEEEQEYDSDHDEEQELSESEQESSEDERRRRRRNTTAIDLRNEQAARKSKRLLKQAPEFKPQYAKFARVVEDNIPDETAKLAAEIRSEINLRDTQHRKIARALQAMETDKFTYEQVVNGPDSEKWMKAIQAEYQSLMDNKTWELVDLPPGRKPIKTKWVFKIKENADGTIERYKARLVAKGFTQKHGIDYSEVFAPVMRHDSFRIFLAICTKFGLKIRQIDAVTAYLNGEITEEIYMEQPKGFVATGKEKKVCKLMKGLYGLKQSANVWNKKSSKTLISLGFKQSLVDPCIYYRFSGNSIQLIAQYVDDFLIAAKDWDTIDKISEKIGKNFPTKKVSDGPRYFIIGNEVYFDYKNRKTYLSQRKYIRDKLREFGLENAKEMTSPMDPNQQLSKLMCPLDDKSKKEMENIPYRGAVGSLIHLAVNTRYDIATALGVVTRYFNNPGQEHWKSVKRIFRYLKGTTDLAIVYDGNQPLDPIGYMDASYASCLDDRKSVTGYVFLMCGAAVAWGSKKQATVAASSTEAEYMAAYESTIQAIWIKNLLQEIGIKKAETPVSLYEDNTGCIRLAENPEHISRAKHIDVKYHFVRERVQLKDIKIDYVGTKDMVADMMTKPLSGALFLKHRTAAGMIGNYPAEEEC